MRFSKTISNGSTYSYKNQYLLSTTIRAKHIWVLNRYYFLFKHWYLYVFVGPIYINVVLLLRCRVISGTHLNFFKRCWIGGVEYLLSTIIKKFKINDVYTWDPVKYSKMDSSIVDALRDHKSLLVGINN
jgi:hypothetical protein